jgi:PadR family transcriptional regulator PadR
MNPTFASSAIRDNFLSVELLIIGGRISHKRFSHLAWCSSVDAFLDTLMKNVAPSFLGVLGGAMAAKDRTDLLQGTLDMLILKALSLGPMHGYGVGQRIMQLAEDMLRVEEGPHYPALYRLGWIESAWGTSENNRRARFYRLIRAGRKQLQVEEENWQRFVLTIGKVMQTA